MTVKASADDLGVILSAPSFLRLLLTVPTLICASGGQDDHRPTLLQPLADLLVLKCNCLRPSPHWFQVQFSLLSRGTAQMTVKAAADDLGVTLIAYSPLALGLLSGEAGLPGTLGLV